MIFKGTFNINRNCAIFCCNKVTFGDDLLLGDNIVIRDSDGHTVYKDGVAKKSQQPISIGTHVWIASHSHILKGSSVSDNSIVAYGSVVTRKFINRSVIIAGIPAKEIQSGIKWGDFNSEEENKVQDNL